MNQMVKNKDKDNNNSINSLVFGRWPQTKTDDLILTWIGKSENLSTIFKFFFFPALVKKP